MVESSDWSKRGLMIFDLDKFNTSGNITFSLISLELFGMSLGSQMLVAEWSSPQKKQQTEQPCQRKKSPLGSVLINEVVLGSHEEESSVELKASEAEFSSASWSNLSTCVVVETSSGTASRRVFALLVEWNQPAHKAAESGLTYRYQTVSMKNYLNIGSTSATLLISVILVPLGQNSPGDENGQNDLCWNYDTYKGNQDESVLVLDSLVLSSSFYAGKLLLRKAGLPFFIDTSLYAANAANMSVSRCLSEEPLNPAAFLWTFLATEGKENHCPLLDHEITLRSVKHGATN
ncbi:uncharacterized protein LOC134852069 [Symsagittifera roscoffensis]|uniref:uncharacterized protein LOC134852069 n=1 Tax=Symsagittifera roscoffensis TaxID=84072 RepID=UPI00307BDE2C